MKESEISRLNLCCMAASLDGEWEDLCRGDAGWSDALGAVQELRRRHDTMRDLLADARELAERVHVEMEGDEIDEEAITFLDDLAEAKL